MKRRNMFKSAMVTALAGAMAAGMAMTSFAAGWQHNDTGWWYGTNEDNTMWYASGWEWIDGNGDGVAECYYFDTRGYMMAGTTTPDGYTVNADGAWVHDDTVQTKKVEPIAHPASSQSVQELCAAAQDMTNGTRESNAKYGEVKVVTEGFATFVTYANGLTIKYWDRASAGSGDSNGDIQVYRIGTLVQADGNPRTDVYDSHGISMAALDIRSHTRQENAKYGEVKVADYNGYDMTVYYANGLDAHYYQPNSGSFYREYGDYPESVGSDKPSLVFKEDITGKSEDVGNALKRKGYDAYVNGWVIVRMNDIHHRLEIHEVDEWGRQFVSFY